MDKLNGVGIFCLYKQNDNQQVLQAIRRGMLLIQCRATRIDLADELKRAENRSVSHLFLRLRSCYVRVRLPLIIPVLKHLFHDFEPA